MSEPEQKKVKRSRAVSDVIHGQIELPDICWQIIDTAQFQRLKNIKQLGTCDWVYPCAGHDRKQHSIGVSYLAGRALRKLKKENHKLSLTEGEITLVQIAGLCHDLGHGPLSHTFDGIYIPLMKPTVKWKHEMASVEMFQRLLEANPEVNRSFNDQFPDPRDKIFVEEALSGIPKRSKEEAWPYEGRGPDKAFLYDIVSNSRNGIDVDKFDYLMRDSHYLKINTFNIEYLMENMGILAIREKGKVLNIVGFRKKIDTDIRMIGYTRQLLHEKAYQHKTNKAIEIMIVDAMRLCDSRLLYKGKNNQLLPLSETIHDMVAFEKVRDSVVDEIRRLPDAENYSYDENVEKAVQILNNVDRRKLYPLIGQCSRSHERMTTLDKNQNNDTIEVDVLNLLQNPELLVENISSIWFKIKNPLVSLEHLKENLIASVSDIHQGMKSEDPVSKCSFFLKPQPHVPLKSHVEVFDTKKFRIFILRLFSRTNDDELIRTACVCFKRWCKENKFNEFEESPSISDPPTPPPSPGPF